jgi:hypothetical protein
MQVSAIQQVIQRSDAEQVQAFSSGDDSVMADTATADHLKELTQANQDLADGGVADIQLSKLEWGPINVNGNSATATAYETWTVHYQDSSTETSRDTNVYTLVQENGAWKIQSDEHPDNAASGPTTSVAPTTPAAPTTPSGRRTPGQSNPTGRSNPNPGQSNPTPGQTIPGFPNPFVTVPGQNPGGTQPSAPQQPRTSPRPGSGTVPSQDTSHNWSGYASTGGKFTSVTGTWTIPQITSNGTQGMGATWVGIGGVTSQDLIQAGTEETDMGSGRVQYSAWVETLPQASQPIRFSVHPGDSITVTISEQSLNNWQIAFHNGTTGQDFKTTRRYTSSHSSAEWVVEAPSSGFSGGILPLDNFGTISFSDASATENGQTVNLSQAQAQPITMLSGAGQALAVPSDISGDGSAFSVSRTSAPSSAPTPSRGSRGGRGTAPQPVPSMPMPFPFAYGG